MPLLGLVTWFLPDLKKVRSENKNNQERDEVCFYFGLCKIRNHFSGFYPYFMLFSTSFFLISILPFIYFTNFVANIYESSK